MINGYTTIIMELMIFRNNRIYLILCQILRIISEVFTPPNAKLLLITVIWFWATHVVPEREDGVSVSSLQEAKNVVAATKNRAKRRVAFFIVLFFMFLQ